MPKYKVCKDGIPRDCKTFDSLKDLVKWAEGEIDKIKVGDLVEVTDTGLCYERASNEVWIEFYDRPDVDIETYTDILNHLNHKSLGYTNHIYSIDKRYCTFKVIAELDNKYVIEAVKGDDYIDYMDGYYVIGKTGVRKV